MITWLTKIIKASFIVSNLQIQAPGLLQLQGQEGELLAVDQEQRAADRDERHEHEVLNIFLRRNCVRVSKDITNPLVWQPGDFIVFQGKHIAVASAMRNVTGYPYIIQHGKDPAGDEDRLLNDDGLKMTGHFRWPETIKIGGIYE